jgi:hypothetical protein
MNKEKIQNHISHLQEKHNELEVRLSTVKEEYIVTVLKKEKLALKDEIEDLKKMIA